MWAFSVVDPGFPCDGPSAPAALGPPACTTPRDPAENGVLLLSSTYECFLSVGVEVVVVRSVACYRSISPSATNLIIGSIAGAILVAAIVLGGTGWGFK
ncbi:unnamed protein product [Gadus morhua 'NCC']